MSDTMNGLTGAPAPQAQAAPQHADDAVMQQGFSQAKARFAQTGKALAMVNNYMGTLQKLASMGDAVTEEDIVGGVEQLVSHGGDPMQLAGLLADMPQGGGAINAWLSQHMQQLSQMQQQISAAHEQTRHGVATGALHMLMHDANMNQGQSAAGQLGAPAAPQGAPNALTGGQ